MIASVTMNEQFLGYVQFLLTEYTGNGVNVKTFGSLSELQRNLLATASSYDLIEAVIGHYSLLHDPSALESLRKFAEQHIVRLTTAKLES